ncbi:GntR family transcriptional regulator [Knoellia locipacati]|uniref:GntR family transcriptional regulator n=1 Tax=Knoellia locipacati TaxID=882824 RepID=A0A512SW91_9MICO|nr:GntR family transcriptional regulator [Knoellia locipacati]GEQ12194.1 GntR family transcriptional regulator [Knoellia locipacati]
MTKSESAYQLLRDRILSGALAPGQVLQQRELAATLGISTTPLREALRRLMTEGLVDLDSHRDARITELRAEQARDLIELRSALDPLAAALAAERRTSDDLAEMRAALDALEPLASGTTVEQLGAHRRFHRAVYTAGHNPLLVASLEQLWDQSDRYRLLVLAGGDPSADGSEAGDKAQEHRALVAAIADRDGETAAEVMRGHIGTSLGARAVRQLGQ